MAPATPLGDPIEIAALTAVYRSDTDAVGFCRLGSVKANLGHLDAAAGVAGLIKATLSIAERRHPAARALQQPQSRADAGDESLRRRRLARGPGQGRPAPRGRQLLRHRRHQRPCRHRTGAARAGLLALARRSPAAALGAYA